MMTSALWGRLNLAAIAGITAAMGAGGIPTKYGIWAIVALAVLQSFTHKINQSTSDNVAAKVAVQINQNEKGS